MRALLHDVIINTAALTDLIPADRWYGSGAVGIPTEQQKDTPPRPFAELRFQEKTPGMAAVKRRRVEIWIHDDWGNYDLIDKVIEELKTALDGLAHVNFEDPDTGEQSELIAAHWVSDSIDLYDDGYRTNTKSTGYTLVGTGA